jgi:hypothetical protein
MILHKTTFSSVFILTLAVAIEPNLKAFSLTLFAPKDNKFHPEDKEFIATSDCQIADCDLGGACTAFPKPAYLPP